jgi:GNAT superfamily N-acetyltransferase
MEVVDEVKVKLSEFKVYIENETLIFVLSRYGQAMLLIPNSDMVILYDIRIDILHNQNQGYGTLLLEYVINYCRGNKYKKLIGRVSEFKNAERLKSWYAKHGFIVEEGSEGDYIYDIKKNL